MARAFNLVEGRSYHTPTEKDLKLKRSDIPNDNMVFRGMIGALLYATRFSASLARASKVRSFVNCEPG